MVLALIGLFFSFQWVRKGISTGANLGQVDKKDYGEYKSDAKGSMTFPDSACAIDRALAIARIKFPGSTRFCISGVKGECAISITAYPKPLHFRFNSIYSFDRYSGKLLNFIPYDAKSRGAKVNAMNYDIHAWQIADFFGKIVAFLISLISASLPIKGLLYIWEEQKK